MSNIFQTSFLKAIRTVAVVALALGIVNFSLTSCGDDENTPRPGDGQKIAAILKANDAYWQHVARGIEAAAKEAGLTAEIHYAAADVDSEGQLKALAALDLTQYKGIVIAPSAPDAMKDGIKKIAAQLPVVIVDTPIDEAVGYRSFIGMDNKAAGKQLDEDMTKLQKEWGGLPAGISNILVFQLEGSPAIAERVEGYKAAAEKGGKTVKVITVPDDAGQIATKFTEAVTAMGSDRYNILGANGTVADVLLGAIGQSKIVTSLLAFDVTEPILKAIGKMNGVTVAQDNYGYGYEGVKALLNSSSPKSVMLAPKFITPANVGDADVARYLNGYEVPEIVYPSFDTKKLTGTFISTSITGIPYPENDVITFTFGSYGELVVGMNYGAFSGTPEWYELPVRYRIEGDKIIGSGYGFGMEATVTGLTDDKIAFDAIFTVYNTPMPTVKCVAAKSTVDYSKEIVGTWENEQTSVVYKADGTCDIKDAPASGIPYYLRGNHLGQNVTFEAEGKNVYFSLTIGIEGDKMTRKGYLVLKDGTTMEVNTVLNRVK